MPALLEMAGIAKEYDGNPVLRGVDLSVGAGEVVCLVGENGAGKSTLMNVLFGMPVVHATGGFRGSVRLEGREVSIRSPFQAMALGIGMVHQEFMLIPGFTVTENIKLNRELTRPNGLSRVAAWLGGWESGRLETLDSAAMERDARAALRQVGLDVDPELTAGELPVGHKQFIEIAREVDRSHARLLVFDEPSAVLTESEAATLIATMRRLAAAGAGILFITHRLDEVLDVADRVVVMRDGEVVGRFGHREASAETLAERMVGHALEHRELPGRDFEVRDGDLAMQVRGLHVDMPGEPVLGVDLDVRRGEILGIGGLAGYGKLGISNGLAGLHPGRGRVEKDGEPLPLGRPLEALRRGVAFVSEDRRGVGLLLDESIALNIGLPALQVHGRFLRGGRPRQQDGAGGRERPAPPFWTRWLGGGLMDGGAMRRHAEDLIERLDIRCLGASQPVRRLSGGNQQKVCIAKAMTLEPDLLLVNEPTRGVDVGAKRRILDELVGLNRRERLTVVLTSSELTELRSVCDRIAIVARGKVSRILPPDAPDVDFGMAMAG